MANITDSPLPTVMPRGEQCRQTYGMDTYQFANPVQHQINDVLADGVVSAGVVVGRVLLARDQLLRVEQLAVGARTDLVCRQTVVSASKGNVTFDYDRPGSLWYQYLIKYEGKICHFNRCLSVFKGNLTSRWEDMPLK